MAQIPPGWLDAVVALGVEQGDTEPAWMATGFLYMRVVARDEDEARGFAYLVTNRHVVGDHKRILVRVNPEAGAEAAQSFTLDLVRDDGSRMWYPHPDESVDVVVVPINLAVLRQKAMKVSLFKSEGDALTVEGMRAEELFEGDGVFVLGFPMGLVGGDRSVVIARSGAIARIRDLLAGASNDFLVDAQVFPGNSGGPVIARPTLVSITGTKALDHACLIGIVKAYVPYEDVAVSKQTGRPRVIFQENTGLAAVHPVDCIEAAIDQHLSELPFAPDDAEEEDTLPVEGSVGPEDARYFT